jgi:hypothetical protein
MTPQTQRIIYALLILACLIVIVLALGHIAWGWL